MSQNVTKCHIAIISELNQKVNTYSQIDVDDNGHPDLLVGALLSEEAILLRALPVLTIKPRSKSVTPTKAVNPKDQSMFLYRVIIK